VRAPRATHAQICVEVPVSGDTPTLPLRVRESVPTIAFERPQSSSDEVTLSTRAPDPRTRPGARDALRALPQIVGEGADPGLVFDPLEVVAVGGLGVVERARRRADGALVAIKRVRHPSAPDAAELLLQEAAALAALRHPNIVPLVAVGRDEVGQPALVMGWVEGITWRALLRDGAHPGWADHPGDRLTFHLRVLAQVAAAAHYAHGCGWLHRDIKPDNVVVGAGGAVTVIDWGLAVPVPAKVDGDSRTLVGTPGYMAPEMIRGAGPWLTPRTDVYLLGAALHEVLTGSVRHEGNNLRAALFAAWLSAPCAYPSATPAELAALANEATRARAEERTASADAFRQRVESYLARRARQDAAAAAARAPFPDWCAQP
jgi:serine/threonine protein kinase